MDSKRMISIGLAIVGALFVIYGFYRMTTAPALSDVVTRQDQSGMYILSVGAVVFIFAVGSLVGKKS